MLQQPVREVTAGTQFGMAGCPIPAVGNRYASWSVPRFARRTQPRRARRPRRRFSPSPVVDQGSPIPDARAAPRPGSDFLLARTDRGPMAKPTAADERLHSRPFTNSQDRTGALPAPQPDGPTMARRTYLGRAGEAADRQQGGDRGEQQQDRGRPPAVPDRGRRAERR